MPAGDDPSGDTSRRYNEQVQELARELASRFGLAQLGGRPAPLFDRLDAYEQALRAAHQHYTQAAVEQLGLPYAAEWLLDNSYVIQQAIRQIRQDMPPAYYRQLPTVAGLPRVYALAHELAVRDLPAGPLDMEAVAQLVEAFQELAPLTMGELWALPVMLRLSAVESLVESIGRLTGRTPAEGENDRAADEARVANAVLSLRAVAAEDWNRFFERVSLVERALGADPTGVYARMDFDTRDQYRKVVEDLARVAGQSEVDVARAAVELASAEAARLGLAPSGDQPWAGLDAPRQAHIGFYLIDAGRPQLERAIGARHPWQRLLFRRLRRHPDPFYLGAIALLMLAFDLALVVYALTAGAGGWLALAAGLLVLLPASAVGVDVVNWLVTRLVKPATLPKLDFEDGIPATCTTMVVIPTLLAGPADVETLLNRLELHCLSNSDPRLSFALLTDFVDAPQQDMPGDAELLALARDGVEALNAKYAGSGRRPFYFFHRRRLWNQAEGCWLGWERKRGKLEEFNRLLLGGGPTSYIVQVGDLDLLGHIRYVITLDTDTALPWESARRLVGTLAHPLNRAVLDQGGRVIAGYTVLQPRVEISPTSAGSSPFSRIFAGDTGLDLYTRAVSDSYQDLFGEGTYVGKGIYDVAAFARSLEGRVPENALLSHDLFEGIHGRAGLVTDVILYENYPPNWLAYARRQGRWIRGDWQLLPWLLPRVPGGGVSRLPNPLSALDRWKIVDNLRRSLLAPGLVLLLAAGWLWLPGSPWVWTLVAVLTPALPLLTSTASALVHTLATRTLATLGRVQLDAVLRWLLALAFMPYEAIVDLSAVIITLLRLLVTRRHLLQWTTAADQALLFRPEGGAALTWRRMAAAPVLAAGLGLIAALVRPAALSAALPLLAAWLVSPQLAYWLSLPPARGEVPLDAGQLGDLRRLAGRTWLFFERFAGPEDRWLPPDHFQEDPLGSVAHRTSPTNIGLLLASSVSAFDLGYVGLYGLSLRLRDTLDTVDRLERHRGHLLNWYDTHNLEPLQPRYVSTVDSGNLAASLLAVRQTCLQLPGRPLLRRERWQGLLDTLALLEEVLSLPGPAGPNPAMAAFDQLLSDFRRRAAEAQDRPDTWASQVHYLDTRGRSTLNAVLTDLVESGAITLNISGLQSLRLWTERVHHHLRSMERELELLVPWLSLLDGSPPWPDDPELHAAWQALHSLLSTPQTLADVVGVAEAAGASLVALQARLNRLAEMPSAGGSAGTAALGRASDWCGQLGVALDRGRTGAGSLLSAYADLAVHADDLVRAMEFGFLYDEHRQVFHIGYDVSAGRLDRNYYDLLASEARIASLVAIAQGCVPPSHWLHLARPITRVAGDRILLSWSGTMFEYLMPRLFLRDYPGTLLAESARGAVRYQVAYGRQRGVPWGISESGYYQFDANQNYQYRAFGAPALGFKRGLADDLVVAPYASLLALPLAPQAVLDNLGSLRQLDMLGRFGFYEAVDFTRSRLPLGLKTGRVQSYMAHHQGMILVTLANWLTGGGMVDYLHQDPRIQTVELLLQERVPSSEQAPIQQPSSDEGRAWLPLQPAPAIEPWRVPADGPLPEVHHLSNGRYSVLVTSGGGGYSRWRDVDLSRWRADTTLDDWGTWLYLQEPGGPLWSATVQPVGMPAAAQEALFYSHKAEFRRPLGDGGLSLSLEVVVLPDDDVEARRVTLTNHSAEQRQVWITSYGEVVLGSQAADRRHPAFGKLFVESEYVADLGALLFRRRPRSADEGEGAYLAHWLGLPSGTVSAAQHETDRARFLGRGHTTRDPAALSGGQPALTGTTGATLDPIFALSHPLELEPFGSAQLVFFTAAADSRTQLLDLAGRYRTPGSIDRAAERARADADRELRALGLDTPALARVEQLYSALAYPSAALRPGPDTLGANTKGQPGLWPYAISGDYPIVLVRVDVEDHLPLVHELLQAHAYWRNRNLLVDLVILNRHDVSYRRELHDQIHRAIVSSGGEAWLNRRGGIFVLNAQDQVSDVDQVLLATAARAVLDGPRGSLAEHLARFRDQPTRPPAFVPTLAGRADPESTPPLPRPAGLLFDNGLGGFTAGGREYVIILEPGRSTPAPWINVVANPRAGFIVSESGSGCTWAENSGENRLTPWANDPVADRPGEALYLRDEETGLTWSPTPLPAGAPAPTIVRHGAGYTRFEHHSHGLRQDLVLFVPPSEPLKIARLRLENTWSRPRRVTATYYAEWVLGVTRDDSQPFILPDYESSGNALLACNPYNADFAGGVAFLGASRPLHGLTADRAEFLGRYGSLGSPAALARIGPAGAVTAGLDPCAVVQIHLNLEPGESAEVCFLLGQGRDRDEALALMHHYQDPAAVEAAWQATTSFWDELLGAVVVHTPEPAFDLLLSRWLLYQAVSCRLWGRSAFYQSSGAYGFRDQLQDVLALLTAAPEQARDHILRAARHQFEAGDVLHWWHPPSDRGIRSRCSDDLLWLPFATAQYVAVTGDLTILSEPVPFVQGPLLEPGQDERYGTFPPTAEAAPLLEHCRRALERGSTAGSHGLPLIGSGDWNDGLNRVGADGRGESVWLGWFLYANLVSFADLLDLVGEKAQAETYRRHAGSLHAALETTAWDGDWYVRAFYDDGWPLGSARNRECQIDSLPQSWAVLSGAADPDRAARSMRAVEEHLVRPADRLALLFTPPFDRTPRDPGYVKGYLPGIRENGGQYTHAAVWAVWALAELRQGDRAAALFRLLNPILHGATAEDVDRYRVEPYVVAGDVYSVPPHTGRGGWTWYTGSAAWMVRAGLEAILGIARRGDVLAIAPCIPRDWPGYDVTLRHGRAHYHIVVENPDGVEHGVQSVSLDGQGLPAPNVPLADDGRRHEIHVRLGRPLAAPTQPSALPAPGEQERVRAAAGLETGSASVAASEGLEPHSSKPSGLAGGREAGSEARAKGLRSVAAAAKGVVGRLFRRARKPRRRAP